MREMVWRSLPVTPVHNIVMPWLDPETIGRMAKVPGQVLDAATLFTMWPFVDGFIQQTRRLRSPSPPASGVVALPLDPETARRMAKLPGQVLDELTLFMVWLFMNGIVLELNKYRFAYPQSPAAPIAPPPQPQGSTHASPLIPSHPHAIEARPPMTDEEKAKQAAEQKAKQIAAQKARDAAAKEKGGVKGDTQQPQGDNNDDDGETEKEENATRSDSNKPWQKNIKYETDQEAEVAANRLGYVRVKNPGIRSKGNAVFRHPRKGDYISRDDTAHKGTWKRFDKTTLQRTGTWNADLSDKLGK